MLQDISYEEVEMKGKFQFTVLVLVTVMLVASLLAACAPAEKPPIKIGFITDLTGWLSFPGIPASQGAMTAMELVGYEVDGRPVELIIEDDAADPAIAMDKARKLVETDKVCMILGPFYAASVAVVADYTNRIGMPEINFHPGTTADLYLTNEWCWAPYGIMQQITYAAGAYTAEVLGYKTATGLAADYVAGYEFMAGFKTAFEERGGKFIQEQWFPIETADFAPYITSLKEADVVVPLFLGFAATGFKQLREFGVKMPIVTPFSTALIDTAEMAVIKDDALGIISPDIYSWNIDNQMNKEFVTAYQERWGEMPSSTAYGAYTTTQIALDALRRTKGDSSPQAIAKALDETDFEGIMGRYNFGDLRVGTCTFRIHKSIKVGDTYTTEPLAYYTVGVEMVGGKLICKVIDKEILK